VPGYHPRRHALGERVKVSASLLESDPRIAATLAAQLSELRGSPLGRWLSPAPGPRIDLGRVVRERAVVLFSIESAARGRAATMMASLIARDVLAVCSELRRIGVPADGLVWFDQCGDLDPATLGQLVTRGGAAGLPALLTTTAAVRAEVLADQVNVLVLHRLTDPAAAERFAGLTGAKFAPAGSGDLALAPGPEAQVRPKAVAAAGRGPAAGAVASADATGQLSQLGPFGLVRKPVVAARALSRLANGEYVQIVRRPERRLVTLGLTVPVRIARHPAKPPSERQAARTEIEPATALAVHRHRSAGSLRKGRAT
jgi:hypothetical protein